VGLASVFGAELTLVPSTSLFSGTPRSGGSSSNARTGAADPVGTHLVVLARDPDGYARLSRAIAEAHLAGETRAGRHARSTTWGTGTGGTGWSSPGAGKGRSPPPSRAAVRPWPGGSSIG